MIRYKNVLMCILIVFLNGCSGGNNFNKNGTQATQRAIASPTYTQTITPTLTASPTHRNTPTPFHTPATRTPASTPTSIPPEARLQFHCLNIVPNLYPSKVTQGSLVIREYGDGYKPVQLWDLENDKIIKLIGFEDRDPMDMAVSPNGQWLAYSIFVPGDQGGDSTTKVTVVDSTGQQVAVVSRDDWVEVSRWLDNEHLLVKQDPPDPYVPQITGLTLLNPFTNEQQDLAPDFRDLYNLGFLPDWRRISETVYDPTLDLVVYPRLTNDGEDVVLEDLIHNKILARISPVATPHAVPIWSPDGSRFVIANATIYIGAEGPQDFELYSINRDGEITQLTNLNAYYARTFISDYRWSPDGLYIVFSLEGWRGESTISASSWAVLNTKTMEVTNYCIEPYIHLFTGPFWSPNSKQLVVEASNPENSGKSRLVVVDIENNSAVQVADNVIPYGWMVAP